MKNVEEILRKRRYLPHCYLDEDLKDPVPLVIDMLSNHIELRQYKKII